MWSETLAEHSTADAELPAILDLAWTLEVRTT